MNILLWVLQGLAALLYGASGVMKVFMFDRISQDVPTFGAMPREAWMALGILELACTIGLIVPGALHWRPQLTVLAAALLALESLVFIWVHVTYHEMKGAPHYLEGYRVPAMQVVADWLRARFPR